MSQTSPCSPTSVDNRHSMKRDKVPSVDVLPMFFQWAPLPISQSSLYAWS